MKKLAFLLLVLSACVNKFPGNGTSNSIDVAGYGTIKEKPDIAIVSLNISLQSHDKKELISNLHSTVSTILNSLKQLKVDSNSIVINDLNIDWNYIYDKKTNIIGAKYSADQTIEVKVEYKKTNIDGIINVVKQMSKINFSISFELSKPKEDSLKNDLIILALKDAEMKAKTIAKSENLEIIDILHITYNTGNSFERVKFTSPCVVEDKEGESVNLSPSAIEMNDEVQISYLVRKK